MLSRSRRGGAASEWSPVTLLQEQTPHGDATPIFGTVRDRLRVADQGLTDAESRAHEGGDAPSGALASSIAAVRLQVTDLLDYVDLLEWASSLCAVADDIRRAIPALSASEREAALETFERSVSRLGEFGAPAEASEVHGTFAGALAEATQALRSEAGADAAETEQIVARLRMTVHQAADGAPLRTRLALEQFRTCESLLG